jgi:hypothetical protein
MTVRSASFGLVRSSQLVPKFAVSQQSEMPLVRSPQSVSQSVSCQPALLAYP